mmetsp:Transcript_71667/g.221671  ORF Transcript_71667/g.221671 Transcript_71667/m.221671 type:complete len:169 (+) Transcript_71667:77-583(+)
MGCGAVMPQRRSQAVEPAPAVGALPAVAASSSTSPCTSSCTSPAAVAETISPAVPSTLPCKPGGLSEVHISLLRQIFDLADRNMDGRLTKRELLIALKRHPPVRGLFDLSAQDMEEVQHDFEDQGRLGKAESSWSDLDTNKDKTVTWDTLQRRRRLRGPPWHFLVSLA